MFIYYYIFQIIDVDILYLYNIYNFYLYIIVLYSARRDHHSLTFITINHLTGVQRAAIQLKVIIKR